MKWAICAPGDRVRVQLYDEDGAPVGEPVEGVIRYPLVLDYALPLNGEPWPPVPPPRPNARGYYVDRAWLDELAHIEGETMHPGQPRDLDLDQWLDGIAFHPANSARKQLGHEAARQLVADLGRMLHGLLPAGRDKSLAFTALEDVLMRANRALALGDGPRDDLDDSTLERLASHGPLEEDPRVTAYKAEQRGERAGWRDLVSGGLVNDDTQPGRQDENANQA